jgi:hypothetical protein
VSEGPDQHEPDVVDNLFAHFDRVMDAVHDRVVRPILLAGRFIAFGFILFLLALFVAAALIISVVRLSTIYLFDHRVWITYLVIATLSVSAGLVIWRKRRPVAPRNQ